MQNKSFKINFIRIWFKQFKLYVKKAKNNIFFHNFTAILIMQFFTYLFFIYSVLKITQWVNEKTTRHTVLTVYIFFLSYFEYTKYKNRKMKTVRIILSILIFYRWANKSHGVSPFCCWTYIVLRSVHFTSPNPQTLRDLFQLVLERSNIILYYSDYRCS